MAKEKVKLEYLVTPVLDQRATTNVVREIEKIAKRGTQLNFTKVVKEANNNVKAINEIAKAAESFSKKLSAAVQGTVQKIKSLGKELSEAQQEAKALEEAYAAESDDTKKGEIQKRLSDLSSVIGDLNKQIDVQKAALKSQSSEIKRATAAQRKSIEGLNKFSAYKPADMFKGVGSGILKVISGDLKGGLMTAMSSMAKGTAGAQARSAQAKGTAKGGPEGMKDMAAAGESLGRASMAMTGAVAAISALVKFISKASSAMSDLNKAMLQGTGFAKDIGVSGKEYASTIKQVREAAMDAHGALLKYGGSSETAMQVFGAFAKESSGSIVQAAEQVKQIGGGDLQIGMFEMAKNAQVYGKALGMEAQDVAGLMGQMVNEMGASHENVQKIMGDVVKQASQAGIPVNKFMSIFKDTIPELDMFTNRIEEVTGAIKLMSKTMDPRALKDFVKAFGKSFDQMDFKQRLKMALVVGPGEMGKIMEKDFKRSTNSMAANLGEFGQEFQDIMAGKKGDIQKAATDMAARMASKGKDATQISQVMEMAQNKKLSQGGVLKQATAMRGMGMMGRMEALKSYAGRFTGGDITGLGEHVAKQLGVSEQEYKAILALDRSMDMHMVGLKKTGRTSSASINQNLKKILKQDGKITEESDEAMEQYMSNLANTNAKEAQSYIQAAATMQMDTDKDNAKSADEIAQENVIATTSIGDKIENVLGFLMEKMYYAINDVLSILDKTFSWMVGDAKQKEIIQKAAAEGGIKSQKGQAQFTKDMEKLNRLADAGASRDKMLGEFQNQMMASVGYGGEKDVEGKKRSASVLGKVMSKDDVEKFQKLYEGGKIAEAQEMLTGGSLTGLGGLNKDDLTKLLVEASKVSAQGMRDDVGPMRGTASNEAQKKQDALLQAKLRTQGKDLDERHMRGMNSDLSKKMDALDAYVAKHGQTVDKKTGQAVLSPEVAKQLGISDEDFKQIAAMKASVSSPAVAVGAPSAPGTKPAEAKAANTAIQDTAKVQEGVAKTAEAQLDQGDDIYRGINDQLSLLKKGVKFEQSWMNSKFQNVLKDATLESFRTALFEFAMLTEWDKVKQWGKDLGDKNMKPTSAADFMKKTSDWAQNVAAPTYGFATGGSIDYDQMARVHKGEYVVPKGGVLVKEGGNTSNKNVTVNATINVHTDADPKQIAAEVHNLYRAH